jgi:hypothetical protein
VYDLRKQRVVFIPSIIDVLYVSDEQVANEESDRIVEGSDEHEWHMSTLAMMCEALDTFTVDITKEYLRESPAVERMQKACLN